MKSPLFLCFFLTGFLADQVTKSWAQRNGDDLRIDPILVLDWLDGPEAFLEFTYVTNPGAAWSMFSDYPEVLTVLAGLALVGIFVFRRQLELDIREPQMIFGAISSGIAGNFWDRVFRTPREVVDFIDVYLPVVDYDYPVFNLADSFIFLGVICFVVRGFRESARERAVENSKDVGEESKEDEPA